MKAEQERAAAETAALKAEQVKEQVKAAVPAATTLKSDPEKLADKLMQAPS